MKFLWRTEKNPEETIWNTHIKGELKTEEIQNQPQKTGWDNLYMLRMGR
jgi:hypothetical protein